MQMIYFFFAAVIFLGNIRLLKVCGFIILLIRHKIYASQYQTFQENSAFLGPWQNLGTQSVKKMFFDDFFITFCVHKLFEWN